MDAVITERETKKELPSEEELVNDLSHEQVKFLTPEQIKYLDAQQIKYLEPEQIKHLTIKQLGNLGPDKILNLVLALKEDDKKKILDKLNQLQNKENK